MGVHQEQSIQGDCAGDHETQYSVKRMCGTNKIVKKWNKLIKG